MEDEINAPITVMYIYKEDESELDEIIQKHDCFEWCSIGRYGNIRLIDVAIEDDVADRFNAVNDNGLQGGRGFSKSRGSKLKYCFSTAFQCVPDEEALSWV